MLANKRVSGSAYSVVMTVRRVSCEVAAHTAVITAAATHTIVITGPAHNRVYARLRRAMAA
jgi:hypothetical protein